MAIYSVQLKAIGRKSAGQAGQRRRHAIERGQSGRSSVAAAAYAAGVRLVDERQGRVHDFRAKGGVFQSFIVGGGGWTGSTDRGGLWNMAEAAEVRNDAKTAREWIVALPHELTHAERVTLTRKIAHDLAERFGVIVDASVHIPDREGDQRNHHAHLLMTTRRVNADGTLGAKTRELDDRKTGRAAVEEMRAMIAFRMNAALHRAGHDVYVDHRTLEAQGIDKPAQKHEGVKATNARRKNSLIDAHRRKEKTHHQRNLEAGAIAAALEVERLRVIREKLAANEKELAAMLANKAKLPRARISKIKFSGNKSKTPSVDRFMLSIAMIIAQIFGNMFSQIQVLTLTAHAVEETAQDMQKVKAIRLQQRNLRRQESRLIAKIMKGKGEQGAGESNKDKDRARRLRRRRVYEPAEDMPDAIAAKVARENAQRGRPQKKPPQVYANATAQAKRTRPQKARYDHMRAAKRPRPPAGSKHSK